MTSARLDLLGGFRLTSGQGQIVDVPAKKDRALLAILAMAPRHEATRDRLAALLWSDRGEEQAKNSLRQALASLRKDFAALDAEPLALNGDRIALNSQHVATDVAEFLNASASSDPAELRQAAKLYAGPLLDGLNTTDNAFEDWLREARADLSARAVKAFESLATSLTGADRIAMAERLIALEPLREASHLALMRAHIAQGQSALAIKQYEACKLLLKRELGVEPSNELQQLRRSIDNTLTEQSVGITSSHKPVIEALPVPARAKDSRPWLLPAIVGALSILVAGGLLWIFREYSAPPIELASKARMEHPLPDKPSIAVLPFVNMSSETGQQHFADGMTDSLITDLSKISSLFVIARNSTFAYQGKPVKVSQVAEELGVRYVVEGSVQRAGDQVRVNAQLIDALSGGHIWADRFDGNVTDIFAAQDAFVAKISEALQVTLTASESQEIASGKTKNILAKEAFDEGWSLYLNYSPKSIAAAITSLKRAIDLDPSYGRAYAALALVYIRISDSYWFKEFDMPVREVWAKAAEYAELAKKYPTSLSYTVVSYLDTLEHRLEEARRNANRAIALDPNDPEAHIGMAWVLICLGEPTEALNFVATTMRLDPNYRMHYFGIRGLAFFVMGELKQAAHVLEEGVKRNPNAAELFIPLSSVLAQLGRREEARQMLQKFLPGVDQRGLEKFADAVFLPFWDEQPRLRERYHNGLRVAALPLDITVESLITELEGSDIFHRMFAAKRLGWFGPAAAQAVPALIEALKNEYVRQEAVQSLGKIGPNAKAAIPALVAMQDEDPIIGFYAKNALKEISGN